MQPYVKGAVLRKHLWEASFAIRQVISAYDFRASSSQQEEEYQEVEGDPIDGQLIIEITNALGIISRLRKCDSTINKLLKG